MRMEIHHQTLEEASTQVGGEARMLLPGVQTLMGFQLMAVFNQRFEQFSSAEQLTHFVAFLLVTLTMGLLMAPAAYHRQAERCMVTERFVKMSSALLTIAMVPFTVGVCLDTYLIGRLILKDVTMASLAALGILVVLVGLWFVLPVAARPSQR
jgi:hypothetical protein